MVVSYLVKKKDSYNLEHWCHKLLHQWENFTVANSVNNLSFENK